MLAEPPIRLCCYERHWGKECADGRFMCDSCFEVVDGHDAAMLPYGVRVSVCIPCRERELAREDL